MENWMNKTREYDKRIGVPSFEGWEEREIEAAMSLQYNGKTCGECNCIQVAEGIKNLEGVKSFPCLGGDDNTKGLEDLKTQ